MRWRGSFLIAVLVPLAGAVASAAERAPGAIADVCASCHGTDGRSKGAIPTIAGMPPAAFVAKMTEFRAGGGGATVMGRIAPGFSPAETARLADYFANLR